MKAIIVHNRKGMDEVIDLGGLIERLKKLRALNKNPDRIGLTEYTWRSFSFNKKRER